MSKYLLAVCYPEDIPIIISTNARTLEEAETRFINNITFSADLDIAADWDEFLNIAYKANIEIGEIYNIEEFE